MAGIKEEESIQRNVGSDLFRIDRPPPGERDAKVTAKIECKLDGWSYEGELSPKRLDLCVAYYLISRSAMTPGQLRFCAGTGTGLGLSAPTAFGFDRSTDYEKSFENTEDTTLRRRVALMIDELVKKGDRMIVQMANRAEIIDGVVVFIWVAPAKSGMFGAVGEALADAGHEVAKRVRKFTPLFGDRFDKEGK